MRPSARQAMAAAGSAAALGLTVRRRAPSDAGRRSSDDRAQGAPELARSRSRPPVSVNAVSSARHRQAGFEHVCTDHCQDLSKLGLGADRAEQAGAGADDRHSLLPEDIGRERPRYPVESILECSRYRAVVFRSRDQDSVRSCDLLPKRGNSRAAPARCRGLRRRPGSRSGLRQTTNSTSGRALRGGPQERCVVRALPDAAADREDPHPSSFTSSRSAMISTSQPSASPPSGRGSCQLISQSRRSTVALELEGGARDSEWIGDRRRIGPARRYRAGHAADLQLAGDDDASIVAELDARGTEHDQRVGVRLEEVGTVHHVRPEVGIVDRDRIGAGVPDQRDRAVARRRRGARRCRRTTRGTSTDRGAVTEN